MFRIMLCCSAGMSTSLLAKKMQEYADLNEIPAEVEAYGTDQFVSNKERYQVVLLGPQISYMLNDLSAKAGDLPIEVIDMLDYGLLNADKVFNRAIELIESTKVEAL